MKSARLRSVGRFDRSLWASGPWDSEPDFFEWKTSVGYDAYATRLDSGAWVGIIIAPLPTGSGYERHQFYNQLHRCHDRMEYSVGVVGPSDLGEGYGEYCLSMEHFGAPQESKFHVNSRGPYKTLEEVKQIVEVVAKDILFTLYQGPKVQL